MVLTCIFQLLYYKTRCFSVSLESPESTVSVGSTNHGANKNTPHHNLGGVFTLSTNIINSRTHHLISKTVFRPYVCIVCEKRIKFGYTVLRCQDCKASSHPSCKNNLPLPCIPPGTPSGKGIMVSVYIVNVGVRPADIKVKLST